MNFTDERFRDTARAFRRTIPSPSSPVPSTNVPRTHVVSLMYPPDELTLSKLVHLRRYQSFIHEVHVLCSDEEASAKNIYDALIPRGCVVQFLNLEFSTRLNSSMLNIRSLSAVVSSVHIRVYRIEKDDIVRAIAAVLTSEDFGIRISGNHNFEDKFVIHLRDALLADGKVKRRVNFFHEVAERYLCFWSEESFVSVG